MNFELTEAQEEIVRQVRALCTIAGARRIHQRVDADTSPQVVRSIRATTKL